MKYRLHFSIIIRRMIYLTLKSIQLLFCYEKTGTSTLEALLPLQSFASLSVTSPHLDPPLLSAVACLHCLMQNTSGHLLGGSESQLKAPLPRRNNLYRW